MRKSSKFIIIGLLLFIFIQTLIPNYLYSFDDGDELNYTIYTENGEFLFERSGVEVGDEYLDKSFNKYIIKSVNTNSQTGIAQFVEVVEKKNVVISKEPNFISGMSKKIALYCSHNDESYVVGDGTESIYGAGGIHDIARLLKQKLETDGVDVEFDETLHIPHDSGAYSRSSNTAKTLLKNNPDAIFDIHRDGTSRNYYISQHNGKEKSMIRIVVGKGNANYKQNEEFALYIMSVANTMYPYLIKDIYYGKGHYNQNLTNNSLLFEMGSHLVEKNLVKESVGALTDVINTALFNTTVNENNGELTINGNETADEKLVTNLLKEEKLQTVYTEETSGGFKVFIVIITSISIGIIVYFINKKHKK